MKPHLHLPHLVLAIANALALAVPPQFETLWQQNDYISMTMGALNFPGIICMFPFGGRFFLRRDFPPRVFLVLLRCLQCRFSFG